MKIDSYVVILISCLTVVKSMCDNRNKSKKYLSFFKTTPVNKDLFLDPDAGYGLGGFDCRCLRNDIEKEEAELVRLKSYLEKKKILSYLMGDKMSLQDKLTLINENEIIPDTYKYNLFAGGLLDDWNYIL